MSFDEAQKFDMGRDDLDCTMGIDEKLDKYGCLTPRDQQDPLGKEWDGTGARETAVDDGW